LVAAATDTAPALGMAGTAPGVRVLPVRVLGKCGGYDDDILAGMRWAAGLPVDGMPANPNPAKVLNMSLGGSGACSAAYQAAVDEITARGVTIVAAAGNSAGGPVSEPANCRGVVAVLALRHVGTKVGFSDLGPEIAIAAPGGNCINITAGSPCLYPILAATNSGTQGPVASAWTDSFDITVGTSFSSPLVAGVVALMLSQAPQLSVVDITSVLRSTARPFPTTGADNGTDPTPVEQCRAPASGVDQLQCYCNTSQCGAGMLDAGKALDAVSGARAQIDLVAGEAVAGTSVQFTARGSSASPNAVLVSYAWSLASGGGIVNGFSSAANTDTVSLTPSAAGSFTLQLTVTDNAGKSQSVQRVVTVAAAPSPQPPPAPSGGGGGASSAAWVAGVALAALLLTAWRRRA
jgi:serine protease